MIEKTTFLQKYASDGLENMNVRSIVLDLEGLHKHYSFKYMILNDYTSLIAFFPFDTIINLVR